jgi:uncharacterized protein with von Willebrand factor type A (vWA) domain
MKHDFSAFDGQPFVSPDELFPKPEIVEFLLEHGQEALDAMQELHEQGDSDVVQQLIDAGLLEADADGQGNLRLTPKLVRGLQHRALMDILDNLQAGQRDGHPTDAPGRAMERSDGTHRYAFGDPLSEVDLGATMRNAAARQTASGDPLRTPLGVGMQDFELYHTESTADCATVILIDQSGSMMRWGRFLQAKRIAMGMAAMVRQRFPLDTVDFVGFYTLAKPMKEADLPLMMPKPVSIRDYQVRLRAPLSQAMAHEAKLPLHFTNLQMGLRQARQLLARRSATNKQVFVITDGQPTAHVQPADDGGDEMLYLLYPPTERTATVTLEEAHRCQRQGIRIASFALIEDYYGMDWVSFIERMTRLTKGIAYYCTSEDLASTVVESYLTGKKSKSYIH